MQILVTGGSGFIGRCIAQRLEADGHTVFCLSRNPGKLPNSVAGDIADPQTLTSALAGFEAVVHCVGIIIESKRSTFEAVVTEGTRNLVKSCLESGVSRIIYISAIGAREDAPSRYHRTKAQAERIIRESGLDFTILRSSIVFGPGDQFINKFVNMPIIPLPGGGKQRFQPIFVQDLAELSALCLQKPEASYKQYDAVGPESLSFKELMSRVLLQRGLHRLMIPIPMLFMHLLSNLADPLQRIYPPLAILTKDQYLMLQEDNVGDPQPLKLLFPDLEMHVVGKSVCY